MATKDHRALGLPINRAHFAQYSWGAAETANVSKTLNNVNMLIERIDLVISASTDNRTVTVISLLDENSTLSNATGILNSTDITGAFTTLADDTHHVLLSTRAAAEFDAIPVSGDLTLILGVSDAPGASGLTVDVYLYGP